MDFLEKFFGKVWVPENKQRQKKISTIFLKQIKKYLSTVAGFVTTDGIDGIIGSNSYVGFVDKHLYLPAWVGCTENKDLNKKAYLYLILIASATKQLKLQSKITNESKTAKHLEIIKHYPEINRHLDKTFSYFAQFQQDFIQSIFANLKNFKNDKNYSFWRENILSREEQDTSITHLYLEGLKSRDALSDYLSLTTTCLPIETPVSEMNSQDVHNLLSPSTKDITEQVKLDSHPIKKINLEDEKKEFNPVTHAFEKLDTADDYQGGYRFDSGDDELMEHMDALQELEMSTVTTGGEAACSIYSSDIHQSLHFSKANDKSLKSSFLYPEWFSKNSSYSSDHCALFETKQALGSSQLTKTNVEKKYAVLIRQYETELDRILNQPTWQKKQKDGVELDIDEYVRYQSDVLSKNTFETPKLYSAKNKTWLDVDISILFDQSLSTDSWIENIRICDVIKESIVMMGILFEEILPNISISSTSSVTRKKCYFNKIKERDDTWDSFFKKIDDIEPQGYTRLGPAIRHINYEMKKNTASKKILIVLTDGKPSDVDSYEGYHGVQDVKKACSELETEGVIPIAILIDKEKKGRFYTMFKNHFVITDPQKFPEQFFDILREFLH